MFIWVFYICIRIKNARLSSPSLSSDKRHSWRRLGNITNTIWFLRFNMRAHGHGFHLLLLLILFFLHASHARHRNRNRNRRNHAQARPRPFETDAALRPEEGSPESEVVSRKTVVSKYKHLTHARRHHIDRDVTLPRQRNFTDDDVILSRDNVRKRQFNPQVLATEVRSAGPQLVTNYAVAGQPVNPKPDTAPPVVISLPAQKAPSFSASIPFAIPQQSYPPAGPAFQSPQIQSNPSQEPGRQLLLLFIKSSHQMHSVLLFRAWALQSYWNRKRDFHFIYAGFSLVLYHCYLCGSKINVSNQENLNQKIFNSFYILSQVQRKVKKQKVRKLFSYSHPSLSFCIVVQCFRWYRILSSV